MQVNFVQKNLHGKGVTKMCMNIHLHENVYWNSSAAILKTLCGIENTQKIVKVINL